jgi:hypothetical protein
MSISNSHQLNMRKHHLYFLVLMLFTLFFLPGCLEDDDIDIQPVYEGKIDSLSCDETIPNGVLVAGFPPNNVRLEVLYFGGNGGLHLGDTAHSTGVVGLKAILEEGAFERGAGSLVYNIIGTPSADGVAYFSVEIGGQTCTLSQSVLSNTGTISSLSCDEPMINGVLTELTPARSIICQVNYLGGNAEGHNGDTAVSIGVEGLTASLSPGVFADGAGSVNYSITGTPDGIGLAEFVLDIGGVSCSLVLQVYGRQPTYPPRAVHCSGVPTLVFDVTNPLTGKTWMDRNLGALRAAISITDPLAYGDLYQWGRGPDGHQCRSSPLTPALSDTDQPGHNMFITSRSGQNMDWRVPRNDNLWQGVNGINNPCPNGYRIPTSAELNAERSTWTSFDIFGAFNSPLLLTLAGGQGSSNGWFYGVGVYGGYWSSSVSSTTNVRALGIAGEHAEMASANRAAGNSVRCIKD